MNEPLVDHNSDMNTLILTTLAANFPGVILNIILENEVEVIEIAGIEGDEGKKYPPSCKYTILMDNEKKWVIVDQGLSCVANYGDCLESLIVCLTQFKYLWASLTPPDSEDPKCVLDKM